MTQNEDNFYFKTIMDANGESVTEEIPIESKGYQILKDDTIKCADCGKRLVDIIKVKENESVQKAISALCPCGGESFLYIITGETYMQASPGRVITNIPTYTKDGIIHMTVEVI